MEILESTDYSIDPDRADAVIAALGEAFELRELPSEPRRVVYWDTFDWRVHSEKPGGARLTTEPGPSGTELVWRHGDGRLRHVLPLDGDEPPVFADDFPPGPWRSELGDLLEMRRLLPIAELTVRGPRLAVLDEEEKTVVRVRVEHREVASPMGAVPGEGLPGRRLPGRRLPGRRLPGRLRIEPVRGYPEPFAEVHRFLGDRFGLEKASRSRFEEAIEAVGRRPGDYSSKVRLDLEPHLAAADAARRIHRSLLATLLENEDGVRRDLDSEFLHDFRVAVRRSRSALSQIKGVFPPDLVEHFGRELRWLGQITGPCRDLDVYLLKMPAYREALPEEAQEDLAPLERFLAAKKKSEHRKLVAHLDSPRYRQWVRGWRAFLDEDEGEDEGEDEDREVDSSSASSEAPSATRPILEVASERIWKVYRKVVKRGRAIDDDTPAEPVHDLRKDCKKLRYLLEFFRDLYPADEMARAIKRLKRLQDVLGDFNDFAVQRESLVRFAREMNEERPADLPGDETASTATLLATGRLLARLEAGQANARRRFAGRFERFAAEKERERFRRLFRS